ncbi:MAG: prepilin-type N-terminal cleavage/methylation domain-containing protein [Nitrospiraceae bacterium]|nr:MAG: prepilin-type N-terminal cleavage/methylation domain-containing protein [Nitrospiraceae bacterium]
MRNDRSARKTQHGFTLIEVLVSLTLLTVVLGAVYSSFFSVQRAVERFDNVSLRYHEARTTLDILRREIEAAILKNPKQEDVLDRASFEVKDRDIFGKTVSSLDLTAFSFRGTGMSTLSYFVQDDNEVLSLMKNEKPPIIESEGYTVDLINGIESFTVEVLFNNKWVKTWNAADTRKLPEAVRVTLEFENNGQIVRLSEYARPMIDFR